MHSANMTTLAQSIHARLAAWRRFKGADEYYDLPLRSPYKKQINDPVRNRFGGGMGAYMDDFVGDVPGVSYINATEFSFSSDSTEFSYIGTMCPKTNTFLDFWRMVWHKQTRVVVNLTHVNDRVGSSPGDKRERYWPPFSNLPVDCGSSVSSSDSSKGDASRAPADWDIGVRTLSSKSSTNIEGLTMYEIELKNKTTGKLRRVSLLWYSQWEDFGDSRKIYDPNFQKNARNVLAVANEVEALQRVADGLNGGVEDSAASSRAGRGRSACRGARSWLVIHCSAGVGRTGTLITIIRAMRLLRHSKSIEDLSNMIDETIVHLRRSRLWMVKTDGEYATIFCTLMYRLQPSGDSRPEWNETSESDFGVSQESSLDGKRAHSMNNKDLDRYAGVGFKKSKS